LPRLLGRNLGPEEREAPESVPPTADMTHGRRGKRDVFKFWYRTPPAVRFGCFGSPEKAFLHPAQATLSMLDRGSAPTSASLVLGAVLNTLPYKTYV
jgi:hypothetical protein